MKVCTIKNCGVQHYAKGFCKLHYRRRLGKNGLAPRRKCRNCDNAIPDDERPDRAFCSLSCKMKFHRREGCYTEVAMTERGKVCSWHGCSRKALSNGLCHKHLGRRRRNGHPEKLRYPPVKCAFEGCDKVGPWKLGLCKQHYFVRYVGENREDVYANNQARRSRVRKATPSWVDLNAIKDIYRACREAKRVTGKDWNVDHIVPIKGRLVCGLHVPWNLAIIPALDNKLKSATHH